MKNFFPPRGQNFTFLQTNRSNVLGSMWSSFNLDFQTNLGVVRIAQKLVMNTSSADDADLGVPCAFEMFGGSWWAICDTTIFKTGGTADITASFVEDTSGLTVGSSTSQFDVTNPAGTTFRYTYDGTGTNPGIDTATFPIGGIVTVSGSTGFAAGNKGTFTITGSGTDYFEVTNASGVVESNKTLGTGRILIANGSGTKTYVFQQSDFAVFDDRLWASSGFPQSKLFSRDNNFWTERASFGSAVGVHKLQYFSKYPRLYFASDTDTVASIDASNVIYNPGGVGYAIQLDKSIGQISTMTANSQYIWIGTMKSQNTTADNGTQCAIVAWDGLTPQFTNIYAIDAAAIMAMCVEEDIAYAMDSEGRMLGFNGYSFTELGRLPIERILLQSSTVTPGGSTAGHPVHFNGMYPTKNHTILVLVKNRNQDNGFTHNESLPSGVWEFDIATGNFTHRYSATLKTIAGTTITDFGQNILSSNGAIKVNTMAENSTLGRGTLLVGARVFTDLTTTKTAIFIDSPAKPVTQTEGQKRAYAVTTFFSSDEIQDEWVRLWAAYKKFATADDRIIFKYRFNAESPVEADITWTSTSTFTTLTDVSAYAPGTAPFSSTLGGEVEVLQATGAGACVQITSIVNAAGTYTVTLDDAVPNVTGTGKVRFQKWIKILPTATGLVNAYKQAPIGKSAPRIQVKMIFEWTGDGEFYKMALWSNEDIKINA